ncbi:MAG TPA: nucleotidyltransferase [Porphyromonadaceae bacterium]|nr:MAG: nucleotidyltransferase [Bacteroidetes bacterium GWC2_46_850]OFX75691.1 MAG: nucleotidyltransferase [Bacteroidetes bacterium GWC1_47_7]HBB01242.1 nucleotidyltransferase [Porphyromonadaceae bacterium]
MSDFERYILPETATIKDALVALDKNSDDVLTLFIVDKVGKMLGTLTDGDVRRGLIQGIDLKESVISIMHSTFRYISDDRKDVKLIKDYKERGIKLLPFLSKDGRIEKVYALNKISSILPIDAVIMAGGKGERLRPLTLTTPKPLLKVGDKCIIDYNVDALISYGMENISVTVNYLGEQLVDHYKEKRNNIQVKCVLEPNFLGTMGSVKFVDSFVNDTVLVMNSDLFTNIDYEDFYLHFLENDADMSVAAVPYSVNVPYGIFELTGRDIQGVKEKPTYNYYANAGIYLIKKKLLDLIPDNLFYNATDFMGMLISKKRKVIRYPLTGYWIDIGKPEDYQKAQELVKHL